ARAYSDYPSTESRVLRLQKEIATLLPCRDEYVLDTDEFQEVKARLGADRLVLHRRRIGDSTNGAVLLRHPSSECVAGWTARQVIHSRCAYASKKGDSADWSGTGLPIRVNECTWRFMSATMRCELKLARR